MFNTILITRLFIRTIESLVHNARKALTQVVKADELYIKVKKEIVIRDT